MSPILLSRRHMLIGSGTLFMSHAATPSHAAPFEWTMATPAEAGFAPDLPQRLDAAVAAGKLPNLHGVLVGRGGKLVLERYFSGEDQSWGRPLGTVAFGPETLHDLRSVTKSLVCLVYGIALAQGKVPAPDAGLMAQFPEYADLAADPARQRLTIAHVLSMTMGTQWDELSIPYTDPANSEIAMENAPDRYRFILDRPIVGEPGLRWTYNGGATALLGRLIARGTGQSLPDFARAALFEPLGISAFEWIRGADGTPSAASGLRLRPRDVARVARMMLGKGQWEGRTVVPAAWLHEIAQPRVVIEAPLHYGYQWYLGPRWIGAIGNGGQRIYLLPEADAFVITTFGLYDRPEQRQPPLTLFLDVVAPALH